ncbi:MAG: hypothetical protein OXT09_01425, partial [Myxococcales bacterium]|nr:hypothetical protein [Myxococcales bacterium]
MMRTSIVVAFTAFCFSGCSSEEGGDPPELPTASIQDPTTTPATPPVGPVDMTPAPAGPVDGLTAQPV